MDALGPSERVPGSSRILMKTTQEPTICTMIEVPRLHEMLATFPHQKVNEIRTNLDNTINAVMSRMNPESRRHDMGGYGGRFLFLTEICADEKIGKETKEKRKGTHAIGTRRRRRRSRPRSLWTPWWWDSDSRRVSRGPSPRRW